MPAANDTNLIHAVFLLTGIAGPIDIHQWISFPFCFIYVIATVGNALILLIIKTDSSLHEPMYIFLSMLAITDLGLLIATMPTVFSVYLINSREISFSACFAQLFFIHTLQFMESSVLLLMAFDRVIAICNPLRYASILTHPRIAKLGLMFVIRSVVLILPLPFLLQRFQYWRTNVLSHSYCLHQDVMKVACADITINNIYGLSVAFIVFGMDSLLIFLSYVMILKTVLSVTSHTKCLKALNTCISHLCAVLLFYLPAIGLALLHRFGNESSHLLQVVLGYVFRLVPPVIHPIVYSIKSEHLRGRIIRVFVK
ncbi:olfactory receptor 51G2-like [Carettochelys insculpta]|uniref:olfactory receptor 51G2-like n=1 Tax=Carettochelys insculpta TaxID=44489 RepID=UPI003EBA9C5B